MVRPLEPSGVKKLLPPLVGVRAGSDASPEARGSRAGSMKETQLLPQPTPVSDQERRHSLTSSPFLPTSLNLPRSLGKVTQNRAGKGREWIQEQIGHQPAQDPCSCSEI